MQSIVSRRKILIASLGAAAVGLTRTAQAAPANVPSIWDGKKMYDSFLKDGTGFSFPHKPNAPVAVVAFDTQCPDCMRLFTRIKPLLNDVDVIFYPISFMNIHSEPQGTTILMSKDPAKTFEEQHEHFKDPDFRGIRYDVSKLPEDLRRAVEEASAGYENPREFFKEKIAEGVATIAAAFYPKKVIVRMSDFKSNEYRKLLGGKLYEPEEENPMLGFRGASRYVS